MQSMRRALPWLAPLGFCLAIANANATTFPERPVTLVMSLGSGGADLVYRKLAQVAGKALGQPVILVSKPGAGGTLGAVQMAQSAKPDGYTIAASFAGLLRQPRLQAVEWDPIRDFTWIAGLGGYTFGVAVHADSPFQTLGDMIEWAKAHPGELTYGTPGMGTSPHLLMETLAQRAGFEAVHVPYQGGAAVTTAMLGGHVMVNVNSVASFVGNVQAGQARALAIFNAQRHPGLPDFPTAKEAGYELVYSVPYGLVGPAGMTPEVTQRLQDAFKTALDDTEVQQLMQTLYDHPWYQPHTDFTQWARQAYQDELQTIEQAGLIKKP